MLLFAFPITEKAAKDLAARAWRKKWNGEHRSTWDKYKAGHDVAVQSLTLTEEQVKLVASYTARKSADTSKVGKVASSNKQMPNVKIIFSGSNLTGGQQVSENFFSIARVAL